MAKGITKAHLQFINLVAKGEGQAKAYRLSSAKKTLTDNTANVEASKLAKRYASEIEQERKRMADAIIHAHQTKEAQEALKSILTVAQVDAILCETIMNPESEVGRLMAIDKYYKRFGHNAPVKQAQTNADGNDIAPVYEFNFNGVEPVKE